MGESGFWMILAGGLAGDGVGVVAHKMEQVEGLEVRPFFGKDGVERCAQLLEEPFGSCTPFLLKRFSPLWLRSVMFASLEDLGT